MTHHGIGYILLHRHTLKRERNCRNFITIDEITEIVPLSLILSNHVIERGDGHNAKKEDRIK